MPQIFHDFDLTQFWKDSDYARKSYLEPQPTPAIIRDIETQLGFKLPASYLELMHSQNGGIPRNTCFPSTTRTSWAADHVAISGIAGIGRAKIYSLCGKLGSQFMQQEWGYPTFGICVCNCPSAGHDMIMLDYRKCGKTGEPQVIHVDQESAYKITPLAKNFETFIRGLVNSSVYDKSAEILKTDLDKVTNGSFSTQLTAFIAHVKKPDFAPIVRNIAKKIVTEKKHFSLHADPLSQLLYDIQFFLYTAAKGPVSQEDYLEEGYESMIAFGDGKFTTGGYAPGFVEDWIALRLSQGEIVTTPSGTLQIGKTFQKNLLARMDAYK